MAFLPEELMRHRFECRKATCCLKRKQLIVITLHMPLVHLSVFRRDCNTLSKDAPINHNLDIRAEQCNVSAVTSLENKCEIVAAEDAI